jgi:hypothetical protein
VSSRARAVTLAAAMTIVVVAAVHPSAGQPTIRVQFAADGRVDVSAFEATPAEILQEWARAGKVEVAGTEHLPGERVSLELRGVSEADAIQRLIGETCYLDPEPRDEAVAGASRFSRIVVRRGSPRSAPETRFSYYISERVAATEVRQNVITTSAVQAQVPEAVYPYYSNPKTLDALAARPLDTQPVNLLMLEQFAGPPEVRFEYYTPPKSVIAVSPRPPR